MRVDISRSPSSSMPVLVSSRTDDALHVPNFFAFGNSKASQHGVSQNRQARGCRPDVWRKGSLDNKTPLLHPLLDWRHRVVLSETDGDKSGAVQPHMQQLGLLVRPSLWLIDAGAQVRDFQPFSCAAHCMTPCLALMSILDMLMVRYNSRCELRNRLIYTWHM